MPEERGSIYKTTANEIGEALKAKLGGEGFAPKDWSENLNLLGIASEDAEAAINSLKESEGSGERGSILLSTANAIGSMLNKKYNSQRGFSPAEWASATRKMKALETDTKSGGIVNLKGTKEVPITSLVGTVNPTLEGVDSLTATRLGKNIFDMNYINQISLYANLTSGYWYTNKIVLAPNTTYTISPSASASLSVSDYFVLYINPDPSDPDYLVITNPSIKYVVSAGTPMTVSFTTGNTGVIRFGITSYATQPKQSAFDAFLSINYQIEVGSSATTFEEYKQPTTYTANLGRTIYGGSADIVKGEGTSKYVRIDLGSMEWVNNATYANVFNGTFPYGYMPDNTIDYLCEDYTNGDSTAVITNNMMAAISADRRRLYCHNDSYTQAADFKESVRGKYIVFKCTAHEEPFTFDPIQINTSGDTENFYTSNGDTAITYYEEPTPYTRGSASGMIASITEANTEFPFTKLKATIAPSVEGKDTVEVKNEGKNLLQNTAESVTDNGITFTVGADGSVSLAGTCTAETNFNIYTAFTFPRVGQYFFSGCPSGGSSSTYRVFMTNFGADTGNGLLLNVSDLSVTTTIRINIKSGTVTDGLVFKPQIEVGSSATQFEPYKNPTTYTAELGETVFGGSVDLVSGEVIDSNDNTFYIEPQEIYPNEGVNNIWNDVNGITEVGYFGE